MNARATMRRILRWGLYSSEGPRRYVRVAGDLCALETAVSGWKSAWQEEPGIVVFGVKPWYLRWFARDLARAGVRVLRWRAPREWMAPQASPRHEGT